ncbi:MULTISPECIES: hypothetical protein [Actinoalloteichus]|uniref:Uncharacterized protein n=1 Tax=Actinoalloteichus fjordicus TaxID=1612552 RepID=A0AAC9PQ74_9PSEU|nr:MULTISPECIES: hypothetical protein [Actinoalloteichus]APU12785.1 hypothetical protein UA74_03520 [Actinoalloteichus fjordicus]APU18757.1 hypothetical protein UA75_03620 [Actinoalloteichus sp. GBA129-24]
MTETGLTDFITGAYGGDLSNPDFSFVRNQMETRPYDPAIEQVRALGSVQVAESTDPNYEVCFGYEIVDGGRIWVLELSMLGPFAVFARAGGGQWHRLIYPHDDDLEPVEHAIFAILAAWHIEFPDRVELEKPLDMALAFTDPENVRVYHALFSDEDFVPWEFSPLYPELSARPPD